MKNAQIAFYVVGIVLCLIGLVKVSIIGYYPSEAPLFFGMLITGAVCTYIGSKIHPETRD
jgi:hypothetical protein